MPGAWAAEAWDADHDNPLIPERIEFVAQRFRDEVAYSSVRTIIGSPIYVARAGPVTTRRELDEYEAIRNQHIIRIYGRGRLEPGMGGRCEIGKQTEPRPLTSPQPQKLPSGDAAPEA